MSAYRGRNGPNLQNYLNNLNTVSPPYDPSSFDDILDLNQDLSIFTNTDFGSIEDNNFNFDLTNDVKNNVGFEGFLPREDSAQPMNTRSPADSNQFYPNYNIPIQPAPVASLPQSSTPVTPTSAQSSSKKTDGLSGMTAEEKSRFAAEEDKRRRNTAASARFRVKKKQREQALEQTLKEAQDKSAKLEARLNQLEMENKWLKELITEKNGLQSKEEMAAAFQKYRKDSEEREVKDSPTHTTGVGTK